MLLQTRIILFVLLTVAAVAGLLLTVADLREASVEQRVREVELERLELGWQLALAEAAGGVERRIGGLTADAAVAAALAAGERSALGPLALPLELAGVVSRINLFGPTGELLYSSGSALDPRPLLTPSQVGALLAGERAPRGTRAAEDGRILAVTSAPVFSGGRIVGGVAAAVPVGRPLDALRRQAGGRVFATDREGAAVYGADDPLWPMVSRYAGMGRAALAVREEGRRYTVAGVPIADLGGGRIGSVLVVRDETTVAQQHRLWTFVYTGGTALIVLIALGVLFLVLRRNFETLGAAVTALHDLSTGETGRYVELPEGQDEIGRIAGAVAVFGQAVREVQRSAGQRERRLRRQQRYIRRQMEQLATTLEDDARQALLDELNQIEAAAQDPQSAQSKGVNDELGLIALGFSRLATRVSMQQVQLLQLVRDLREALEDKRRLISLQQELEIARTMQLSILPQEFPEWPELDLCARMVPAKQVGGDFYDFFPLGERRLAVCIADVSGKGIPAAFFMLITRTMLRAIAGTNLGPAETMRRLNNLLSAENEQMMFVTVFYGEIDLDTGLLTYCNAGHNPPYRVTADGAVVALEKTPGIALATFPDLPFGEKTVQLDPRDTLVLFTDGVSEAFDANEVMYGEARLEASLGAAPLASSRGGLDRMMDGVASFTIGAEQSDDITGLVIHWRGQSVAAAAAAPVEAGVGA